MLFLSSIISPCVVCVFARCWCDLSALAVLYAHDRYCRGLGRVLVLIIHGGFNHAVSLLVLSCRCLRLLVSPLLPRTLSWLHRG